MQSSSGFCSGSKEHDVKTLALAAHLRRSPQRILPSAHIHCCVPGTLAEQQA